MGNSLERDYAPGQRWRHFCDNPDLDSTLFIWDQFDDDLFEIVIELPESARREYDIRGLILQVMPEVLDASELLLEEEARPPDGMPPTGSNDEQAEGTWHRLGDEPLEAESLEDLLRSALEKIRSLAWAIRANKLERVRRLLAAEPEEARDPSNLHAAIQVMSQALVALLLDCGADVNATTSDGYTAVDRAAQYAGTSENAEAIIYLLERRGAFVDLNSLLRLGRFEDALDRLTSQDLSAEKPHRPDDLIDDLIYALKPDQPDHPNQTSEVWTLAADVLTLLLEQGVDPNKNFPLERAVRLADPRIAQILLEHNADPHQAVTITHYFFSRRQEMVNQEVVYVGDYLFPRGEAMRALLRRHGAKSPNDPEVVLRERDTVREHDEMRSDSFLMKIEGKAQTVFSTAREKAQHRYARAWIQVGQYARALRYLEKLVQRDENDVFAIQMRAWILATCPDDRLRDRRLALRLAIQAQEVMLSRRVAWENDGSGEIWHISVIEETIAAAVAEWKRYGNALRQLAGLVFDRVHPTHRQRIQRMQACFEARQPYREDPVSPELLELGQRFAELEDLADAAAIPTTERELEFPVNASGALKISKKHFGLAGVQRLLAEPGLEQVISLDLVFSSLADEEVLLLAERLEAPRLSQLDLSNNIIRDKVGAVLLAVTRWPKLTRLRLQNNRLGQRTARALAANPALASLGLLDLDTNHLRAAGVAALASAEHLPNLTELNLNRNNIRDEGVRHLALTPHLPNLQTLHLGTNRLSAAAMEVLASSPLLARLTSLDLFYNRLGDAGAVALGHAPPGQLATLHLYNNGIGTPGAEALAAGPLLDSVTTLDLSSNPIGSAGVSAIASSSHLAQLDYLALNDCQIDNWGALALAESPFLQNLQALHLAKNPIREEAAEILRGRFGEMVHF